MLLPDEDLGVSFFIDECIISYINHLSNVWLVSFSATSTAEAAQLEPIQEEVVEEFETIIESPIGAHDTIDDVDSPSLSFSSGYSNIFSFPADNAMDKYF